MATLRTTNAIEPVLRDATVRASVVNEITIGQSTDPEVRLPVINFSTGYLLGLRHGIGIAFKDPKVARAVETFFVEVLHGGRADAEGIEQIISEARKVIGHDA